MPKIESYPILTGFSFEDRTLALQVRKIGANIDLFQRQAVYMVTLVKLEQHGKGQSQISLFIPNALISQQRATGDFQKMINDCR